MVDSDLCGSAPSTGKGPSHNAMPERESHHERFERDDMLKR